MLRKAMFAILLTGFIGSAAMADTLLVKGIHADNEPGQPARGATKEEVLAGFGEPVAQNGPVGDPPISNWEYQPFVVYFEYDRVLHSVAKRQ